MRSTLTLRMRYRSDKISACKLSEMRTRQTYALPGTRYAVSEPLKLIHQLCALILRRCQEKCRAASLRSGS